MQMNTGFFGPCGLRNFVTAAVIGGAAAFAPAAFAADVPLITVTGTERSEATPDMATISLGVRSTADTAADATARVAADMTRVLEALTKAGIAARDLQTNGLQLGPRYDYPGDGKPPVLLGYEASNQLQVRVRDLALLGQVIDLVVKQGASEFGGLNFGLSDPAVAEAAARAAAVQDARLRAEQIATAAGARLGKIVSIRSGGSDILLPSPVQARGMVMQAAAEMPVAPGEISYSAEVTVSWELVQN